MNLERDKQIRICDDRLEHEFKRIKDVGNDINGLAELVLDWDLSDKDKIANIILGISTVLEERVGNIEDIMHHKRGLMFQEGFDYEVIPYECD